MPEPTGKEPSSAVVPDNRERPETRTEVIGTIFGDEEIAPSEPEEITTPSTTKEPVPPEKTEPEKTEEPPAEPEKAPETPPKTEEYSEDKYREAYGEVVELRDQLKSELTAVEKQKEESRKYFTEQTEKIKALRQDLGVDEAHKVDKEIGKDMAQVGEKPPPEFVNKDYLSEGFMKEAANRGFLKDKQDVALFSKMKPMLNLLLNSAVYQSHQSTTSMYGDLKGEITPIVESRAQNSKDVAQVKTWKGYIASYIEKYGKQPPEELMAFGTELQTDPHLQSIVNEEKAHTAMRRIMHDPGAKSLLSFKAPPPPVPPKTPEPHSVDTEPEPPPAEPLTPMGKRQKQQSVLDKAVDKIFGDK